MSKYLLARKHFRVLRNNGELETNRFLLLVVRDRGVLDFVVERGDAEGRFTWWKLDEETLTHASFVQVDRAFVAGFEYVALP